MTQFPAAALGKSALVSSRGLRDGRSPWLLHLRDPDGTERTAVLRVDIPHWRRAMRTEAAALAIACGGGLPAPTLLDADLEADEPWILCTTVPGSSTIPVEASPARLRALGMLAARIQSVPVVTTEALPRRDRPIGLCDFASMRQRHGGTPLLLAAESVLAALPAEPSYGTLIHGDLWMGNVLLEDDVVTGVVDWDCAGVGHPSIDLGSLRFDAAISYGLQAIDDVLAGWESVAGHTAPDVARFDLVAALQSPTDMLEFAQAHDGQGRPDLTADLFITRRDAFISNALDRLTSAPASTG